MRIATILKICDRKNPPHPQVRRSLARSQIAPRQSEIQSRTEVESLGNLAFEAGFRIRFAAAAVAAVALGGIEAGVGPADKRLSGVAVAQGGDSDGDSDAGEVLVCRAVTQLPCASR